MICLTGDVHQEYDSDDQSFYEGTEFESTLEYLEIAKSYGIATTLFLTGKVAEENPANVTALSEDRRVEIGGHTWSAFRPQWLHLRVFQRLAGSVYGPKSYQRRDIRKTLSVLKDITGQPIRSWRTHAYNSTESTYEILSSRSVQFISDQKSPTDYGPYKYDAYDLTEFPINVITDHEHLIHGSRTAESVEQLEERGWSDAFGSQSYPPSQWGELVIKQIDAIEERDGTATLLIHPGCMKAADDFKTFEKICQHIAENGYNTQTLRSRGSDN